MPVGLVLMKWDEREGVTVIAQIPEDLKIDKKALMQIYAAHEYTSESGMVSLNIGALNIGSYYTGSETGLYLNLLLNLDEDPDLFEDGLADASRTIVNSLANNVYKSLMPSIYSRICVYPSLNEERKFAVIYLDEAKRMLFQRLQKEGCMLKSEIAVWLRDKVKSGFVDLEGILLSLIKESIVKSVSVKGAPSEVIYLISDLYVTRTPPTQIIKDATARGLPPHLFESYKKELVNFFNEYKNEEQDNLALMNLILDPAVYETLNLLRQAVVTRDDLEKLKKKGVEDIDAVLKELWKTKMIIVLQDERGNEYYGLQSDIKILKMFPEWVLNTIRSQYTTKLKSDLVLQEYINVLKEVYLEGTGKKKSKKGSETPAKEKKGKRDTAEVASK